MTNKNHRSKNSLCNYSKLFVMTIFVASFVAAILLVLLALILDKLGLTEARMKLLIYSVYIFSALAAGFVVGKWQRENKFMWGAISGMLWFVIIFLFSLVANGMKIDGRALFPAIISTVGGGMLGGMIA